MYTYESDERRIDKPIVVLTNGNTASAAELFTAALKDYDMCSTVARPHTEKALCKPYTAFPTAAGCGLLHIITTRLFPPTMTAWGSRPITPSKMDAYLIADRDSDIQLEKAISVITGN